MTDQAAPMSPVTAQHSSPSSAEVQTPAPVPAVSMATPNPAVSSTALAESHPLFTPAQKEETSAEKPPQEKKKSSVAPNISQPSSPRGGDGPKAPACTFAAGDYVVSTITHEKVTKGDVGVVIGPSSDAEAPDSSSRVCVCFGKGKYYNLDIRFQLVKDGSNAPPVPPPWAPLCEETAPAQQLQTVQNTMDDSMVAPPSHPPPVLAPVHAPPPLPPPVHAPPP